MTHIGVSKELLTVCNMALDTFGTDFQVIKNIEEMSESITQLSKYLGAKGNIDKIRDEICDVLITSIQMMIVFGDKEIQERIDFKSKRLLETIKQKRVEIGEMH